MWQLQLRAWIIATVLWFPDLYIDTLAIINRAWIYTLVTLIYVAGRFNSTNVRLIYATGHKSGADITLAVKCYYSCDKVKSCGSLYRWLAKFGEVDPQINLILAYGNNIRVARINIDDEIEELTSKPIDSLYLEDLPVMDLYPVEKTFPEKITSVTHSIRVRNIQRVKENVGNPLHDSNDESQNEYHKNMCDHDD